MSKLGVVAKALTVLLFLWSLFIAWPHGPLFTILTFFLPLLSQVYWYIEGWIYFGSPFGSLYEIVFDVDVLIMAFIFIWLLVMSQKKGNDIDEVD